MLPAHYITLPLSLLSSSGLREMHKILPSHFPELKYRPLVMTAVDNDQELIALTILQHGATYHVAGKVGKYG